MECGAGILKCSRASWRLEQKEKMQPEDLMGNNRDY